MPWKIVYKKPRRPYSQCRFGLYEPRSEGTVARVSIGQRAFPGNHQMGEEKETAFSSS